MRTEDHKCLGYYLLEQANEMMLNVKCKKAMVFGSIEPDLNFFTYLRGSVRKQTFKGHNYENTREYIQKLIQRIESDQCSDKKRYYHIGRLLHYTADAFTYPHNTKFTGSISDHCNYEKKLHVYMNSMLINHTFVRGEVTSEITLGKQIEKLHDKYLTETHHYVTDCNYIMKAVSLVFQYFTESEECQVALQEKIA